MSKPRTGRLVLIFKGGLYVEDQKVNFYTKKMLKTEKYLKCCQNNEEQIKMNIITGHHDAKNLVVFGNPLMV